MYCGEGTFTPALNFKIFSAIPSEVLSSYVSLVVTNFQTEHSYQVTKETITLRERLSKLEGNTQVTAVSH